MSILFDMNIQDIHSQTITITQLRRDITILDAILDREGTAYVLKNQTVKYIIQKTNDERENSRQRKIQEAMSAMHAFRMKHQAKSGTSPGSDFIVKARDEEVARWKKNGKQNSS